MPADPSMAEAALAYVTETAPVLALTLDAQGRIVALNAQAERILGTGQIGQPFTELVLDFSGDLDIHRVMAMRDATRMLTLKRPDDMPESYRFRFFSVTGGTLALGSVDLPEQERLQREVLGLNRELNNLTRQLHLANGELRELNQLKNRFLGMAAHDLRRPIGVILSYTEFVLDEAGHSLTEEHRGFLQTTRTAAATMKRLIDDFLDVAVIESGRLRLDLAAATAADIVNGALPIARLPAATKNVELVVEPPDSSRPIRVDTPKLQQVLLNLIGNAVEHSQPGRRVWISTRPEAAALVFEVRDEGPGIAPEEQDRIFETFVRGGTGKTAGERSAGLGLAIARQVVEAHGGRIWVESAPGHGATFRFSVPEPAPAADAPPTDAHSSPAQQETTP